MFSITISVPRIYKAARPGSDYQHSLKLLYEFKEKNPNIPTKSGLMLGLGETDAEVEQVMRDLRDAKVDMITIGQYLQPSKHHFPVQRYVSPEQFEAFRQLGDSWLKCCQQGLCAHIMQTNKLRMHE